MRRERFEYLVRFAQGQEERRSLSYVQDALRSLYLLDLHFAEPNPSFARDRRIRTLPIAHEHLEPFLRLFVREILKYPPMLFRKRGAIRSVFIERLYKGTIGSPSRKSSNLYGLAYASTDGGDGFTRRIYAARDRDEKPGWKPGHDVRSELQDTIHHELLHVFFSLPDAWPILEQYWQDHLRPDTRIFWLRLAQKLHLPRRKRATGFFNDYSMTDPEEHVAVVMAHLMSDAKGAYGTALEDGMKRRNPDLFVQLNTIEGAFNVLSEGLMDDAYFRLLQENKLPPDYWLTRPDSW